MKTKKRAKKVLRFLLTLCMVLSMISITVFAAEADGLCDHHTTHTDDCGYIAAVEGADCTHVHNTDCGYTANALGTDCSHTHDDTCGYAQAVVGADCAYICDACLMPASEAAGSIAPTANSLTYNGTAQELITAGVASGGELQYSLDGKNYSADIPTGINAGDYTVWYKLVGNGDDSAAAANSVSVTIKKAVASVAEAPAAIENLVYTGSVQQLVTPGIANGGTMMYNALNSFDRSFSEKLPTGTAARSYTVYYYVKGDANHENSAKQQITVVINPVEIDHIDISFAAPEAGETPQGYISYGLYYTRPTWSPDATTFDFNTVYSVSLMVTPKSTSYVFSEAAYEQFREEMSADGWTIWGSRKSMTLNKTFDATRKATVTITAQDQTITYGDVIDANTYTSSAEVSGLEISANLTASTDNVTANGTITPHGAIITVNGEDVTENYSILYESAKLVILPDTSKIGDLSSETVTSANVEDIKAVQAMMTSAETDGADEDTLAEWTAIIAKCNTLLDAIEAAQNSIHTESIEHVKDVTAENVQFSHKTALEQAKTDLESALETYTSNYTDEEVQAIQEDILRIEKALLALEHANDVIAAIAQLPKSVEPDDEEAAKDILAVKTAYDELTKHEQTLVGETNQKRLNTLVAALTDYKIVKGSGNKWTYTGKSGLTFTANGAFSKFQALEIDGKVVNTKYYTAKSGSTIVTVNASYLQSLSEGKHTITVVYSDGKATGSFTTTTNPATGDESNLLLWLSLLGLSSCSLAILPVICKKTRKAK